MAQIRGRARWMAFFAAWVLALGFLAPTVSHWAQAARAPLWVEVCTAQGPQRMALGADSPQGQAPRESKSFMVDCGLCLLHAQQDTMAFGEAPRLGPPGATRSTRQAQASQALRAPSLWQPQQSRAPPARA